MYDELWGLYMFEVAMPTARKARDTLVHAHEVGALIHQARGQHYSAEIPHGSVRMPMYRANDSNDLRLIELISPAHELHRRLIEGRRPMTRQHTLVNYSPSPYKSLNTTPRTKLTFNNQAALTALHASRAKLNARPFAEATQARPKQSILTASSQMHQTPPDHGHIKIHNSKFLTHQESMALTGNDRVTTSGFLTERTRHEPKVGFQPCDEQRASDLRLISRLWHQECRSSGAVQQRLAHLLNGKYKEAFEDGRLCSMEKCKRSDFKAEVAQIERKLKRARASPQTATVRVRRALAVACVDETLGCGLGDEYATLERSSGSGVVRGRAVGVATDASAVKAVVARVQRLYLDVRNITGFMLDQLGLSGRLK